VLRQRILVAAVVEAEAAVAMAARTVVKVVVELMVVVRKVEAWLAGAMVVKDGLVGAATEQAAMVVGGLAVAEKEVAPKAAMEEQAAGKD